MVASFSRCRSVRFLLVCCHFLSADDGHERFLQCPGLQHAEDTLVDDWCTCCWRMSMTSLQSHLSFLKAFHSVRHPRIGCRSQHRGKGLLPLRMKVRRGCSPDVLSPPLHRIQCWRPCLPGQPLIRVPTDPPSPEPSWLDDSFLGAGCGSQPRSAPVPFFPEVHEELMKSWMAPFTASSRSSVSSVLTTLNGVAARGYVGIPQVERSVVVHLCWRNAATWRNRLRPPSKACKLTAALSRLCPACHGCPAGSPNQGAQTDARG